MHSINIRSVQHFLYCPHRWGLMEIEQAWAENYFVVKADLLHQRVHDPKRSYSSRQKRVFTSVAVWNDLPEYDLFGITDCIEVTAAADGITLPGLPGKHRLCIVEYKPTRPKQAEYHEEDAIQAFAQKLCVDYVFGGDCRADIYYADVKKRITLPFATEFAKYDAMLKGALGAMRSNLELGIIPPVAKGQHCGGCSLHDLCMPKLKRYIGVRRQIAKLLAEEDT